MFDFIPIEDYTLHYYNIVLVFVIIMLVHTTTLNGRELKTMRFNYFFGIILFLTVLIYMGLRPISGIFTDMKMYEHMFNAYENGEVVFTASSIGFRIFTYIATRIMTVEMFFLSCALLYVLPVYVAFKKWYPKYYFFAFLMYAVSFSFWAYGTNTIRAGMATSFIILGVAYKDKKWMMSLLFLVAFSFHTSMIVPIGAFIVTFFYNNTRKYLFWWFFTIILSLAFSGIWLLLFSKVGFAEDKLNFYFLADQTAGKFRYIGFRWDFLLYSSIGIYTGYYFIIKREYKDKLYIQLYNTYLIANSFWILVIRANFSDRFAFLSWFLMSILISYPLLKKVFWKNQFSKIGLIVCLYFLFTYIMNVYILR